MTKHRWQPRENCMTRDGKECVILGYSPDGELFWHSWRLETWSAGRERNTLPQFHPKPPTTKSDVAIRMFEQRVVINVDPPNSNVELEFDGDELIGFKMIGEAS